MNTPIITQEMAAQIQKILQQGNRAEVMIEQGKIVVEEIRGELDRYDKGWSDGSTWTNGFDLGYADGFQDGIEQWKREKSCANCETPEHLCWRSEDSDEDDEEQNWINGYDEGYAGGFDDGYESAKYEFEKAKKDGVRK